MNTIIELEKKINSELTTKINNSEIKHNQLYQYLYITGCV